MRPCLRIVRAFLLSVAASAVVVPGVSAATADERAFSRAPYLQFSTTNSIYVVWRNDGPIKPVVRFGKSLNKLTGEVSNISESSGTGIVVRVSLGTNSETIPAKWRSLRTEENLKYRKLHSAPVGTFQYEVRLMDLDVDTKYYYAVFDGEKRLTPADESYSFRTMPPVGTRRPIRFWSLGDGGTGRQEQADVFRAMLDVTAREKHPLDFWLHLGDMAYGTGRDMEFQSRFFESYELALRSFVCWPTEGNHEGYTSKGMTGVGPYYDAYVVPRRGEAGGLASGTETIAVVASGAVERGKPQPKRPSAVRPARPSVVRGDITHGLGLARAFPSLFF